MRDLQISIKSFAGSFSRKLLLPYLVRALNSLYFDLMCDKTLLTLQRRLVNLKQLPVMIIQDWEGSYWRLLDLIYAHEILGKLTSINWKITKIFQHSLNKILWFLRQKEEILGQLAKKFMMCPRLNFFKSAEVNFLSIVCICYSMHLQGCLLRGTFSSSIFCWQKRSLKVLKYC